MGRLRESTRLDAADAEGVGSTAIAVGKRTRTSQLSRRTRHRRAPAVRKTAQQIATDRIEAGWQALSEVRDEHLPEASAASAGREFQRSRDAVAEVRRGFQRAESAVSGARQDAASIEDGTAQAEVTEEIGALDAAIEAVRPDVEEAVRLAPEEAASMPIESAWDADASSSWEEAEAQRESTWNASLDAEEAARSAPAIPGPLQDDRCAVDGPHAPYAFTGINLYLNVKERLHGLATGTYDYRSVGPGEAGPYRLYASTDDGQLVYYLAYHQERQQNEWVIGPESVEEFAASVDLYVGAAARLLPGSANVEGSQADGADAVRDPDSVVKQEAFGRAPWQPVMDYVTDPDNLNGGASALVFARNARLRLTDYAKPAKEMAEQLAADVAAGKVDHLDARARAVDGRNALLEQTRQRQSPSARYASRTIKEEGKTLAEMTSKKVKDNLRAYNLSPETRALLDADSALWGQYATAMGAGDDVMKSAMRELGESPAVSRSIIQSAGKTNRTFTRLARWGGPVGLALGALGAADMIVDVVDDAEAHNWHAAAGEAAGFAGGLVGGEAGAMGAVWLASVIVPGAGTGVVIVASIVGSMIGSALGSYGGRGMIDMLADGAALGAGGLATAYGAAGGFAGVHSKDHPAGYAAADQLADAIYATEDELANLATAIPQAQSRDELQGLQKMRLDVLSRRQEMEDLLTAIKLGAFDGPQECAVPEPEPPPEPEPFDQCALDDDCDAAVLG